jgi:hypothetical protein
MKPSEQPLVAKPGIPARRRRERVLSTEAGCFVDGCEKEVEWAGWWYRADGARHLTESCSEHSDHYDFTPVTRFCDPLSATSPWRGRFVG